LAAQHWPSGGALVTALANARQADTSKRLEKTLQPWKEIEE
jgi:hypothetical protein